MQYDSIILGSIERISDTGIVTTLNISCSWFNRTQAGCCLDSPYNFQLSIKIRQLKFVMQCSRQSDLDSHSSKKYMNNNQTICQILLSDQFHTEVYCHLFIPRLEYQGELVFRQVNYPRSRAEWVGERPSLALITKQAGILRLQRNPCLKGGIYKSVRLTAWRQLKRHSYKGSVSSVQNWFCGPVSAKTTENRLVLCFAFFHKDYQESRRLPPNDCLGQPTACSCLGRCWTNEQGKDSEV